MIVDYAQRLAVRAVGRRNVAFEVPLPQQIWRLLLEAMSRIWRRTLCRFDPAVPAQDLMHGGCHRHRESVSLQAVRNLARAPGRMPVTYRQHLRFGRSFAAVRRHMWSSGAVGEFVIAGLPASQPLVAHVGADTEPAA